MSKIIYYTGGTRSGKSKHAEKYIINENYHSKLYLATAIAFDDEMQNRINVHKENRGNDWITLEAFDDIIFKLEKIFSEKIFSVILLECVGNLITNQMLFKFKTDWEKISKKDFLEIQKEILNEIKNIFDFCKKNNIDLVIVSNEVGMSLVSNFALGRYFQDIIGKANQFIAENSDEAYLIVSGLKIKLK